MLPTTFKESNFTFLKPADMTDEQCSSLPVWRGPTAPDETGAQFPVIISCWKFSPEDLEEIQKTGHIWLSITGNGMPPVALFTEHPFAPQPVEP
jgi:hypothetical protein